MPDPHRDKPDSNGSLTLPSTTTLTDQFQAFRERIDTALAGYAQFDDRCPPVLQQAVAHSLLAPGKRLRPLLVLLAAEACDGSVDSALPAACAVEMVHTYSLIHDDLPAMDDDDLRRGLPTCHRAFGEAMAILAGDALQATAFEVIARDVQPASTAMNVCRELASAAGAHGMVGGQADDMAPSSPLREVSDLERLHRRKTGALFLASLRIGGHLAEANQAQMSALNSFGEKLGLAFQIRDDLLDFAGDEELVGKRVGKDSGQGKMTFPALLGPHESEVRARRLIEQACRALGVFGPRASRLEALARFVLERNL